MIYKSKYECKSASMSKLKGEVHFIWNTNIL